MLFQSDFISRSRHVHGDTYDYSIVEYRGARNLVKIICPVHGVFEQLPPNHWKGVGCPQCGVKKRTKTLTMSKDTFMQKAIQVHKDKYDYSKVEFTRAMDRVTIICPEHGEFHQRANNHLSGVGCPKCGKEQTRQRLFKEYSYPAGGLTPVSDTPQKTGNQRLFLCPCERTTWQSAYAVVTGKVKTCGSCSCVSRHEWLKKKWGELSLDSMQDLPEEWAPFSSMELLFQCTCGNKTKVRMADVVDGHTLSCGCLIPGKSAWSPVRDVETYLTDMGVVFDSDNRQIISPFELDIWIPSHNLAIEFNGGYYHSLDGTESPLAKYRHRDKYLRCTEKGILLLQIDEHEWGNPTTCEVWKSIIASKLGRHRRIPARKTTFRPIPCSEADAFLDMNHLQGATPATRWSFGLFHQDDLVGVITFCRHQHTLINLSRMAFKLNTTIVGGAQKLFKNALSYLPGADIISFSSNRYSDGGVYPTLGFMKDGDLPPSYQWYFKGRVWNKRSLRKAKLATLLPDFRAEETEHQNLYRHGARCLYDAGYQKWLYRQRW